MCIIGFLHFWIFLGGGIDGEIAGAMLRPAWDTDKISLMSTTIGGFGDGGRVFGGGVVYIVVPLVL